MMVHFRPVFRSLFARSAGAFLAAACVSAFLFFSFARPCGAAPARADAQDKARIAQEPLRNEVTVTLKLVQIYVTDNKGKPALNLGMDDFILRDNGKLQTISAFEKHFLKMPAAPAMASPAQAVTVPPAAAEAPSVMNRKYIFLIDYVKNSLKGIEMARKAALEFMDKKLQPGDEVALFSISTTSGLMLHEYLTTDHDKVQAAIRKLHDMPGIVPGAGESTEGEHEIMGMELINAEIMAPHIGGGAHLRAPRSGPTVLFPQIQEWAKSLGHIPGKKTSSSSQEDSAAAWSSRTVPYSPSFGPWPGRWPRPTCPSSPSTRRPGSWAWEP